MELLRFANPQWLLLLLALPLFVYRYVRDQRRDKGSVRFSDLSSFKLLQPSLWSRLRHGLFVMRMLGMACLIGAMARPQAGKEVRQLSAEGIDIMLTLDVSSSMELNDLNEGNKSRLEVAKEVVGEFIQGRSTDRIGMVVFAGESFTQCPMTLDYDILLQFLGDITIADQAWDGTAIGMALVNACNRLRDSQAESKVVILLTDGINNAGEIDPLTAAEAAAAIGIRVYTIGVGSDGQVRRPVPGIFGTRYQTVQAEIDEETLKAVASQTKGRYYRATSEEKLEEIYREIGELEKTEVNAKVHIDYADRYLYFLWPGLLLLVGELLLADTRFRRIP